jgi:outer membrane protein TolC
VWLLASAQPVLAAPTEPNPGVDARQAPAIATTDALASIELAQALKELDQNNPSLAAASARVEEIGGVIRQVKAQLHPTLVAVGSYVRNNEEVALDVGQLLAALPGAPALPSMVIQPLDAWTAAGNLRVPLFVPNAWHDIEAAEALQRAGNANVEAARAQTHATFATLAYSARALEEVVAASERAIDLAHEQAQSAQRRVAAGTSDPLDVLRTQTEEVSRQSDLARARADLERVRLALGTLIGRTTPVRIVVPSELASSRAPRNDARRAELAALDARAAVAEAQIDSARSRVLPQLTAQASVFASNQPYPTGDKTGWRVSAELTIPLYDGGVRYGKRQEAEASLRATRLEHSAKQLTIRQEVKDAEREIAVAEDRLRLAQTRQNLAGDAAASAKRSYDAGVATTLDVLDANDKLYKSEVAMAEARARLAQARIELGRALGHAP